MEAMPLDPGSYGGTYKLIGGRLALDFINTVSWPCSDRTHDWLSSPENLALWISSVGLEGTVEQGTVEEGTVEQGTLSQDDLNAARALRTTIDRAVRPIANDRTPAPEAVVALNRRISDVAGKRMLNPHHLGWEWLTPATTIERLAPVILDAAEILAGSPSERIRHCPSCDWVLEDSTRNGKRRWCDMADCGSRAKAKRYYERSKHETRKR